jgi:hypothetical protein
MLKPPSSCHVFGDATLMAAVHRSIEVSRMQGRASVEKMMAPQECCAIL